MKKIRTKTSEKVITAAVMPNATKEDIKQFNCSCVNHLCGCKSM